MTPLADRLDEINRSLDPAWDALYDGFVADLRAATAQSQNQPLQELVKLHDEAVAQWGAALAACEGRARERAQRNLADSQKSRDALAEKLARIYGHEMSIHTEVDTSLLGGMRIRVGDEVIDGSTAGKIARLRAQMA